jgi:hypothetical protein
MMAADSGRVDRITALTSAIGNMTHAQHVEILRIITTTDTIKINENRSGVYINMSLLAPATIEAIQKYVDYLADQEAALAPAEAAKNELGTGAFLL